MHKEQEFTWNFQRLGGLEQVMLSSSQELCHLDELDPKLWVALSCPASGFEFDDRTLELVDTDGDGRIRLPEVVEAVQWTCARLTDVGLIMQPEQALPLNAIDTSSPQGKELLATARAILAEAGKPDANSITRDDVTQAARKATGNLLNGDGIIPAHQDLEPAMKQFVEDALTTVGGVKDASGAPGINKAIAQAFLDTLRAWKDWNAKVSQAGAPLGEKTPQVYQLLLKLKPRLDDYFLRCELASFAPQSTELLNAEQTFAPGEEGLLNLEHLAELPIARIEADRPLSLGSGLNPAWRDDLTQLFTLAAPLLRDRQAITRDDWIHLQHTFEPYASALSEKPPAAPAEVEIAPSGDKEVLGCERIEAILSGGQADRFMHLLKEDEESPSASTEVAALERLVLYYLHLYRLLMNFVSFRDFYTMEHRAAFLAGTLYLDSRSCRLCLLVDDVETHVKLATLSELCLVYCECTRTVTQGGQAEKRHMSIVAAMTAGDSDLLIEGRNGVFVDNDGEDWDATVVKIISNPISLWQAMWDPYKRFGRWVNEQAAKFAAARQDKVTVAATQAAATSAASTVTGTPPATPTTFDIGKNVGIFAAVGLALGAIGTALASMARALFALAWWQFPLVFVGLFLLISGPSLLLAWLKLRKRTLGPALEASGWAVNSRVAVNLTLAHELTQTAELPANAEQGPVDPLGVPKKRWPVVVLGITLLVGIVVGGWLWYEKVWPFGHKDIRQTQLFAPNGQNTKDVQDAQAPPAVTGESPPGTTPVEY